MLAASAWGKYEYTQQQNKERRLHCGILEHNQHVPLFRRVFTFFRIRSVPVMQSATID